MPLGEREGRLEPPRGHIRTDLGHPLDPPEATAARCDQARWKAVAGGEGHAPYMGSEQEGVEVAHWQPAEVTRMRHHHETARVACIADEITEKNPLPVLCREPTASAVDRGADLVLCGQVTDAQDAAAVGISD